LLAFLYPFAALNDLVFTLLCYLLFNWWAPLFADKDGNLPNALCWLQTFDASLDEGWQGGYFSYTGTPTGFRLWWLRVRWLYRNPGYGYSYWVDGVAFDPKQWTVTHNQIDAVTGKTLWIARGPNGAFNINYLGKWGNAKIGWKAWNYWDGAAWKTTPWGPAWRAPICFTYTPFKRA
jgi:hypothetical protein